jgi:hypothetical protein
VVQALEIAKKHILWWKYQSYFSFLVLMTTLITNAKISNAELDEQVDFQM